MTRHAAPASLLAALLAACASGPSFSEGPAIAANPHPAVPLAALVTFTTPDPVETTLSITDGTHSWEQTYDDSHDPSRGLAVLGMRPNREHQITVRIASPKGTAASEILTFTTPPLPEPGIDFPPIEVVVSKPEKMEPGVTLFNPRRRKVGRGQEIADFNSAFGMLMALDSAGEPVWFYRSDSRVSDFEISRNGNILYCTEDYRLIEIDWLGNTLNQWYAKHRPEGPAENAIAVDALTFHHEIDETPDGNILALSSEWKELDNYYTDEYDEKAPRKGQKVMGDVIVEFDRQTGEVVWEWHAFDHMDPFRIGYETFSGYWERRGFPDVVDWSHANNLLYDETDDSIIVNFRYQAAAMKIDRKTKEIKWIFGEPTGWGDLSDKVLKPEGDVHWPFHHHSPSPTPNGTLLIFDNGNYQARPFRKPTPVQSTYSRAVEYAIDEKNGTVRELWQSEQNDADRVISIAMGDVDWLPKTENILVAYGALLTPDSIPKTTWESSSRQGFSQWTRLREYVRSDPPEVVYEVVLDSGKPDLGWTLFGAERIDHVGP